MCQKSRENKLAACVGHVPKLLQITGEICAHDRGYLFLDERTDGQVAVTSTLTCSIRTRRRRWRCTLVQRKRCGGNNSAPMLGEGRTATAPYVSSEWVTNCQHRTQALFLPCPPMSMLLLPVRCVQGRINHSGAHTNVKRGSLFSYA